MFGCSGCFGWLGCLRLFQDVSGLCSVVLGSLLHVWGCCRLVEVALGCSALQVALMGFVLFHFLALFQVVLVGLWLF